MGTLVLELCSQMASTNILSTYHSSRSHSKLDGLLQFPWGDWPSHCNPSWVALFEVPNKPIRPARRTLQWVMVDWAPSPQLEARSGSVGVICSATITGSLYLSLAPSWGQPCLSFQECIAGWRVSCALHLTELSHAVAQGFVCLSTAPESMHQMDPSSLSPSQTCCTEGTTPKRVWQGAPLQFHPRWMHQHTRIPLHCTGKPYLS